MRNSDWFFLGLIFSDKDGVNDIGNGVLFIIALLFLIWLVQFILDHTAVLWLIGGAVTLIALPKLLDR